MKRERERERMKERRDDKEKIRIKQNREQKCNYRFYEEAAEREEKKIKRKERHRGFNIQKDIKSEKEKMGDKKRNVRIKVN